VRQCWRARGDNKERREIWFHATQRLGHRKNTIQDPV
jgi:hypothetical protein